MMKRIPTICVVFAITLLAGALIFTALPPTATAAPPDVQLAQAGEESGCLSCHEGIENIREPGSDMMKDLDAKGGCVACHGGDPEVTGDIDDEEAVAAAHQGAPDDLPFDQFYPDPGSVWIADLTCGQCHTDYAHALERSLMNTEAGKIQGNLWAWGVPEDQKVIYGNYDVADPEITVGSEAYQEYMHALMAAYPDQFPESLEMLPNPSPEEIAADPKLAAFTYQRQQCQRCHVGVKGRSRRGDWRGMGCSSCHIPYGNEGLYEGGDPTVPEEEGHMMVHSIQGTREARGGVPTETCVSCHNRGKRIGVSYQGIMEFPYGTPFSESGDKQPKLHTKYYLFIKEDLHHEQQSRPENPEGGMLCQDCHTTIEMHGDGAIPGTTLGQVEIECADCHGTPTAYPWELPLGYGEEFAGLDVSDEPRGLGGLNDLLTQFGTIYSPEAGYLLTARGNPFGEIVLTNDGAAVVHSASGKDFQIPLLKDIAEANEWSSQNGEVAMEKVAAHVEALECYGCHADWAPQCYGCHVNVNYSDDADGNARTDTDWVASGNTKLDDGTHDSVSSPGKVSESRSYLRWEAPVLGINGEGRVTPLMPGCQVIFTVISSDGDTVTHNEIGRTPPGTEGAGEEGQRGMDMAPVQPHTAGRQARTCESCHSDPKALGYGIEGGRFLLGYEEDRYIDLKDADGNVLPENVQVQMPAIEDLVMDLSQIVEPETGQQMMTVGSHWPDSGPLAEEQRVRMQRTGVCMGCHQNMADAAFWTDQVIATFGQAIANQEHIDTLNQVIQASVAGTPVEASNSAPADAAVAEAPAPAEVAMAAPADAALMSVNEKASSAVTMAEEAKVDAAEAKADAAAAMEAAGAASEQAASVEATVTELAEAPAPQASDMTMWVIVALLLGLLFGGGIVYFARK